MKIGLVANRDHPQVKNIISKVNLCNNNLALFRPHRIIFDYSKINYDNNFNIEREEKL